MFKNYRERGQAFAKAVRELIGPGESPRREPAP
jgi:hypothetical protein